MKLKLEEYVDENGEYMALVVNGRGKVQDWFRTREAAMAWQKAHDKKQKKLAKAKEKSK